MVLLTERRVLTVQPSVHRATDDEGYASRTMVTARAVVLYAAAELGKHEYERVLIQVMLGQISGKISDGRGYILPKFGVGL